jgi:2-amino-4-hydroxy-6-hydroxymethyldihydropteridine diphosphokinase
MGERKGQPVFIGLGSNAGNLSVLREALERLGPIGPIQSRSRVYETIDRSSAVTQPFYNAAVCLHAELAPLELKEELKRIEAALGRRRKPHEVTIDLDLCLYGSLVLEESTCRVPHPLLLSRSYMIVPVAECDPDFLHPETKEPLRDIAERVRRLDTSTIRVREVTQ